MIKKLSSSSSTKLEFYVWRNDEQVKLSCQLLDNAQTDNELKLQTFTANQIWI